ncbi:MAG: 4Fe-4S dicluster domain-containing protein [Deltaproteobacteria bacterium]|nr:4Fe-4S dicluster domain-containing protein [Deltaproteobacteria bacterium]
MEVISSFVEGPLLMITLIVFIAAVIWRSALFLYSMSRGSAGIAGKETQGYVNYLRFLLPLHRITKKRPLRVISIYLFHLFLVIVPVWLSGHIILWEDSSLGWSWMALPEGWADGMTIFFVLLAILFLVRRIALPQLRKRSSLFDYSLILIAAIPFASGFALSHGAPEHPVRTIHVLGGELLLVVAAFLFLKSCLDEKSCTGCASCEVECPTGTLISMDKGNERIFSFDPFRCINCGTCISICPEEAAHLKHTFSLKKLFKVDGRENIRSVTLSRCQGCGELIAPDAQIEKIGKTFRQNLILLCNRCKGKSALMEKLKKDEYITDIMVGCNQLRDSLEGEHRDY